MIFNNNNNNFYCYIIIIILNSVIVFYLFFFCFKAASFNEFLLFDSIHIRDVVVVVVVVDVDCVGRVHISLPSIDNNDSDGDLMMMMFSHEYLMTSFILILMTPQVFFFSILFHLAIF